MEPNLTDIRVGKPRVVVRSALWSQTFAAAFARLRIDRSMSLSLTETGAFEQAVRIADAAHRLVHGEDG